MDRREFLKTAGLGLLGLAVLPLASKIGERLPRGKTAELIDKNVIEYHETPNNGGDVVIWNDWNGGYGVENYYNSYSFFLDPRQDAIDFSATDWNNKMYVTIPKMEDLVGKSL